MNDGSITASTRILGVTGWPVGHSLSPLMHNAAIRAASLDFAYLPFPISPENFERAVRGLAAAGVVGLNCTVPHKRAALDIADEVSEPASHSRAVNTLVFREDGSIYGANTDVEGYTDSLLHDAGFDLRGKRVVQIGTGGAGRAMALGTLQAGARELILLNRTLQSAELLAEDLRQWFPDAVTSALSPQETPTIAEEALTTADLVSNATSLGLRADDPFPCDPQSIAPGAVVFDAVYRSDRTLTTWLEAASQRGLRVQSGLGMLVRQGVASLRIWTGIEPDLDAMRQALPTPGQGISR